MNSTEFNDLYNQTAQFEVMKFRISLIVTGIILVISLIVGIYLMFKKDTYVKIEAIVVSQDPCITLPKQTPTCNSVVSYTINNNKYTNNITLNSPALPGDSVFIEYDTTNPNNIQTPRLKLIWIGLIIIGIALFMFGIAYLQYYFSSKSKIYAVSMGVVDATNFIKTL